MYAKGFVRAVLRTARAELARFGTFLVQTASGKECLVAARVQELNEQKVAQMTASLKKRHANLGHPSNASLIRVLKNGGANQQALDLARDFKCPLCEAQRRPAPAHPAQTHRVTEFQKRVGLDVKRALDAEDTDTSVQGRACSGERPTAWCSCASPTYWGNPKAGVL